eukprot:CAMPEP_0178930160 /NCGR_PEP_ID=MMETSP0786-20121207/21057_1 /TAXON_ID=186022 /ORGANISM="Thalassionema frauenfeldii, Strain CCMP 1798" /LENGTH=313 /DNA_ID=CAMNT_0020606609 /DNA_START=124 /DNA_END=1065 /DNA_ORIENTATION=+
MHSNSQNISCALRSGGFDAHRHWKAGALAAYPMDYVKSQLQTEKGRQKYKDGFDAARDILQQGGPLAFYRGCWVNVIGVAPEKTIKLGVNGFMRTAIQSHFGYLPLMGEVLAGGLAGMSQVAVTNPLEVVKVRMQTSEFEFKEIWQQAVQGELYEGADACLVRDSLFSAILFPLYAHMQLAMASSAVFGSLSHFWVNLLAGSLAAFPAAFLATPADVIKTRMQQCREMGLNSEECALVLADGNTVVIDDITKKNNFVDMTREILANGGSDVFFSGWLERVVRSVPQFGVTLALFDVLTQQCIAHGWLSATTSV